MVMQKFGNIKITDAGLTAERQLSLQDTDNQTIANVQDVQNAAADKASYRFSSSATDKIETAASAVLTLGNSDFTVLVQGKFLQSANVEKLAIWYFDGSNYLHLRKTATNYLELLQVGSGTSTTSTTSTLKILDGVNQTVSVVRSGTTITFTVNGVSEALTGQTVRTFTGSGFFRVGDAGTSLVNAQVYRAMLVNYAFSASKVQNLSAGAKLDWEDVGGGLKNTVAADQDFSSNTGFWALFGSTTITSGVVRFSSGLDSDFLWKTSWLAVGKRYKVVFNVTARTTGGVLPAAAHSTVISVKKDGVTQAPGTYADSVGLWEIDFSTPTGIFVLGGHPSIATTLDVDNLFVYQYGAVLDLEPEGVTSTKWYDQSGNNLHGTVTNALATNKQVGHAEGSWTPIGNGVTFSNAVGYYIRVGNVVHCWFYVLWPVSGGTGAAAAKITNLPFTNGATVGIGTIGYHNYTALIMARIDAATAEIILMKIQNTTMTNNDMYGYELSGHVCYRV